MTHQTFQQWQQAPVQGMIPQPDWQKEFICDVLSVALPNLQAAHDVAKHLKASHSDLYMSICDALNACNEALERLTDAPDDLYDVAPHQGHPIKGKIHAPQSAFDAFDAIDITNDPDFEF